MERNKNNDKVKRSMKEEASLSPRMAHPASGEISNEYRRKKRNFIDLHTSCDALKSEIGS